MRRWDLVLLLAGVCAVAAGFDVDPALGFLAAAVALGVGWYLLDHVGDDDDKGA